MDPEEKVRYAVLKLIASFSPQTSASHTLPVSLLKEVANRCKDKKSNVRIEAISVLARLYNLAFEQM